MPSYVLNDELSAAGTTATHADLNSGTGGTDDTRPATTSVRRSPGRMTMRIVALLCAAAAALSLSACGGGSGAGSRAVALAASHSGQPYAYGAAGPSSFDCSGFVQYVYGQMGIRLPRTATDQANASRLVPQSQAAPGDLIFFGSPGNFYHVGIYAGNGEIWYAPKSGDVVKEAPIWTSAYYVGKV